jgi:hypothetical protein
MPFCLLQSPNGGIERQICAGGAGQPAILPRPSFTPDAQGLGAVEFHGQGQFDEGSWVGRDGSLPSFGEDLQPEIGHRG